MRISYVWKIHIFTYRKYVLLRIPNLKIRLYTYVIRIFRFSGCRDVQELDHVKDQLIFMNQLMFVDQLMFIKQLMYKNHESANSMN